MSVRILDGAFGTLVSEYALPDEAYVLDGQDARGCVDVLCLTKPDVVADIHRRYARAGADIVTTNSLNANAVSLAAHGLGHRAYDICREAVKLAKSSGRCVAGSIGPTGIMLSKDGEPKERLREAYKVQAQGLIDGGADALLIETVTDALNAQVAVEAVRAVSADMPIMISATLDASGLLYSGQTVEQFCEMMADARPMSIGLNCGFGVVHLLPYLSRLSAAAQYPVSFFPSAGLPGHYASASAFAASMAPAIKIAAIIGGCCGTTPAHISALKTK